jgi:hypothetical protein
MKITRSTHALLCGLVAALNMHGTASAVSLRTVVAPIYQIGNGSLVNIGHTVVARTDYNRLTAGGTYSAQCGGGVPVNGQRTLSTEDFDGGLVLTVTIPEFRPAMVSMPGFYDSASRGQTLYCVYNWTSKAVEAGYSISYGGISFQTGNGEMTEGSSVPFIMRVRDTGDVDEGSTCIP